METVRNIAIVCLLFVTSLAFAMEKVDINSADEQTLSMAIKGIGAKKAAAIIAYRKQHGPFKTLDELTKVKGIGTKTVMKNRDRLIVTKRDSNELHH